MSSTRQKTAVAFITFGLLAQVAVAETVDNPDYAAWAACKLGATATLHMTSSSFTTLDVDDKGNHEAPIVATRTEQLVEVLPDTAIVSLSTSLGKAKPIMTFVTIPAKVDKALLVFSPESPHPNLGRAKLSDAAENKEMLTVNGKPIETMHRAVKLSIVANGRTIVTQFDSWKSPDVPGGVVKSLVVVEGRMSIAVEGQKEIPTTNLLVDFSKPDVARPRPAEEMDDRTPQGLIRMIDRGYLLNADVNKSLSLLHAESPTGKQLAQADAVFNISIAQLEKAARDQFGAATMLPEEIDHVVGLNGFSRRDIEIATLQMSGDKARVFLENGPLSTLIRVAGHWRFDVDADAREMSASELKASLQTTHQSTELADRLTKELKAGKYKTEAEFQKVMTAEMVRINPPGEK